MDEMLQQLSRAGRLLDCGAGDEAPDCGAGDHVPSSRLSLFCFAPPQLNQPFAAPGHRPLFRVYGRDTPFSELREATGLFLVFGACPSPALSALAHDPAAFAVVVDPDRRRIAETARALGDPGNILWLTGDVRAKRFGLDELFPPLLVRGFPAVLVPSAFEQAWMDSLGCLAEYAEVLYYRAVLHPLQGHDMRRSLPLREMARDPYCLDQHAHCFENLADYAVRPDIAGLRGAFQGGTALLVAAGPDLDKRLELIRHAKGRILIICVNNALRSLSKAGIEPDICLTMDPTFDIRESFAGVPPMPDCLCVAHRFCHIARDVFSRVAFFGNSLEAPLGRGTELARHGSVISAAFSLAELLGARRCILAGVQLASRNPWRLSYSQASVHGTASPPADIPLSNRFPQLYPVPLHDGSALFTTLNFRDAAQWLLTRIARSGIEVVNTSPESLVRETFVAVDENPEIPAGPQPPSVIGALPARTRPTRVREITAFGVERSGFWRGVRASAREVLAAHVPLDKGAALFRTFEANTVSYLVTRHGGFSNKDFHSSWFDSHDPETRRAALADYLRHVEAMADGLLERLNASLARLRELGR